jgi:hypothetical protein
MNLILFPVKSIYQPMINFSRVISLRYFFYKPFVARKYSYYNSGNKLKSVYDDAVLQSTYPKIREAFGLLFYLYTMAKAAKKKAAPKKRAEHYEPKVKTDLSFDELIAMSVNKQPQEKKTDKKKWVIQHRK